MPIGAIGNFFGGIYAASGFTCGATTCGGGSIGGLIVGSGAPGIFSGVQGELDAGQYAIQVSGTNLGVGTANQTSYVGFIGFVARPPSPAPEPGTLALLGLGLAGLGLSRRRKAN